ncbi:1-phosphatidylinositol 4,5-bisphosphate phosphodiesterase zeta-1 isoform X2 [Pseudophryne corroboree]|uniref:1-phosphatidylinositol 4,5-bisphosphate phosphodiesterase zeta-1 isoform X2 n=1 Tax=Pseudophryne corroboree TaxID=495146 RepID=UPI003081E733
MEEKWLETVISQGCVRGKVTYQETLDALHRMNVAVDAVHARSLFKQERDPNRTGFISTDAFRSIYEAFVYRKELVDIFKQLSTSRRLLPPKKLEDFLRTEQHEAGADGKKVAELIEKYELSIEARRDNYMTLHGFIRFMTSEDNHIFRREHNQVYQDMTHPLSDYFISTSHNTYLISDQLVGQSHLWAYGSALMRGCRCVEIDCWDGVDNEPVVYHGFTLTSKILFKTIIYVIEKYAFVASHYPLILSLENHCSPRQQEVMANHLIAILGDKLLTAPVTNSSATLLPSPEALRGKILIKYKKTEPPWDPPLSPSRPSTQGQVLEHVEELGDDESGDEEPTKSLLPLKMNLLKNKKEPKSKLKVKQPIAALLSDLVIYTKSQNFVSFQHSRENQKFYENNSLSERKAQRLARGSGQEFIAHTMKFLTRIYPKGTRASSSNFYPQEFWNVGCQMVALNFQTPGIAMDMEGGKFLDNGRCGYVLKPEFLRSAKFCYDPYDLRRCPMLLSIKVISGSLLPPCSLSTSNTADPVVILQIYGAPRDECSKQTQVRRSNAFNPQWNQTITFSVQVPELALLRFCVQDQLTLISNEFLGQYTLPLRSISRGYRHVPLLNKHGQSIVPASLFVHIWFN